MNEQTAIILQKLKSKSKKMKLSNQLVLQLFCQEEFLRRLSRSAYREKLILKGGLFLFSISKFESRPTMDIDFLAMNQSATNEVALKMVKEIIDTHTENYFIQLIVKDVSVIAEHKKYHGTRIKMTGIIGNTRTPVNIDIGAGDVIVPRPETREIAVQLEGYEKPTVLTYSLESTIAEKFDAIIDRMELNGRMKDFYDIYYLAIHYSFEGKRLYNAIFQTLQNRERKYNTETLSNIDNLKYDSDMLARWKIFCRKSIKQEYNFDEIIGIVIKFIGEPFKAIVLKDEFNKSWMPDKKSWEG